MNWLLLIVAVIIIGCMLKGYQKGLIRTVFSIGTFIATIILVFWLVPVAAQLLENHTPIYDNIKKQVIKVLDENATVGISTEDVLDLYKIPDKAKQAFLNGLSEDGDTMDITLISSDTEETIADYVAAHIIEVLAYVILFLIVNIAIRVLGFVLNLFSKLPLIGGVNKLAGLALGFIEGIGCVWILFLIISIVAATEFGQQCFHMIQSNPVLATLYDCNFLLLFIG